MGDVAVLLSQPAYELAGPQLTDLVRSIEALGYESVWLLDSFSRDPFIAASFILDSTTTLKVGTGIVTVYSRDAMAAAQARDTFAEYYPGRFLMGLGASNETIVKMRGGEWLAPVKKMSSYLKAVNGAALTHAKPAVPVPLHIAAHAAGLQSLAVEEANGIITWILPVQSVSEARVQVGSNLEITANFPYILNEDPREARQVARSFLAMYINLAYYQSAYLKVGFEAGDFADGGSDRLIDAIVAWGNPEMIRSRVDAYFEAGASRVVINPIRASEDDADSRRRDVAPDWPSLKRLAPLLVVGAG